MGPHFLNRRRGARALLVVATALTALLAAAAAQTASAGGGKPPSGGGGQPPCPSCPDRTPPPGSPGGAGQGAGRGAGSSGSQATQAVQPLISLGSISVDNGVASLTGEVNAAVGAAASALATVKVTVNAAPVSISANGDFSASVNLNAKASIVLKAGDSSNGQTATITIPASAIPSGGVAADALAQIDTDAVTLLIPADGLISVDGTDVSAGVHVKAIAGIAGLTLNGVDLLAKLRIGGSSGSTGSSSSPANPSSGTPGTATPPSAGTSPPCHHTATAKVSGTAKSVKMTVTAVNGASQTSTLQVRQVRSVIRIGRMISVSAFGAWGIRITGVRFNTSKLFMHRVAVTVTVRDRRNYLVRDAVLMLRPTSHRFSIAGSQALISNRLGRATFSVPISGHAIGRRLYLTVVARTPLASTHLTRSVYLG